MEIYSTVHLEKSYAVLIYRTHAIITRSWIITTPLSIQATIQFLNHFYVVNLVLKEQFYINNRG